MGSTLQKYLRTVLTQIVIWAIAFAIFSILREYGQETVRPLGEGTEPLPMKDRIPFQLLLGVASGILFGSYQFVFKRFLGKNLSFGKTIALASIGYAVIIFIFILIAIQIAQFVMDVDIEREQVRYFFRSGGATVVVFYCFLVGALIELFQEMDKKFGPGNLLKMLRGKFYKPKEDQRIFMFLDMRASTTIAEKLGHIKHSRLVQDCFRDIAAVEPYKAEVYQYVGDEAVLTWPLEKGLENNNCIKAFFAFQERLQNKSKYYKETYGLNPEFKAGLHGGMITVAEVGEIKREIAYHGDTINTAARIQAKCNEYRSDLLISATLLALFVKKDDWALEEKGAVELKGKSILVKIFGVNKRNDKKQINVA